MTHLIDDVARAMTGAAPQAGMREAVLARIERRRPARFLWVAAPIAAAALVVVATGLRTAGTKPGVAPASAAIAQTAPVTNAGSPAAVSGDPADDPLREPVRSRRQPAPVLHVRTIPALSEPAPLSVVDIQPDALGIPLLQLRPIVNEPITIRVIAGDSGGRE